MVYFASHEWMVFTTIIWKDFVMYRANLFSGPVRQVIRGLPDQSVRFQFCRVKDNGSRTAEKGDCPSPDTTCNQAVRILCCTETAVLLAVFKQSPLLTASIPPSP